MDHSPACEAPSAPDCRESVSEVILLGERGLGRFTMRMRMQRRRPKTMMRMPPLNMTERTHFLRVTRLDFQIIWLGVSVVAYTLALALAFGLDLGGDPQATAPT